MSNVLVKAEIISMIQKLPEKATYDDLMYELYVRQAVEDGLEDSRQGRKKDVSEIMKKYGL